jgi:preprotein translocase subunit SecG
MGLFHFLIVVQGIIAAALVGVILMQRSEGGGLGSSGSPAGLMSARGAADFLTRTTAILATIFVLLSISLAFVAAREGGPSRINETAEKSGAATKGNTPAPVTSPATGTNAPTTAPVEKTPAAPLDK